MWISLATRPEVQLRDPLSDPPWLPRDQAVFQNQGVPSPCPFAIWADIGPVSLGCKQLPGNSGARQRPWLRANILPTLQLHLPREACVCAKPLWLCPTLCNPLDCSPPGYSVHGILQARILEWVAISYSRGSSQPRDQTHISYVSCVCRRVLYHQCHLGIPLKRSTQPGNKSIDSRGSWLWI